MNRIVYTLFWIFFFNCSAVPYTSRAAYTMIFKKVDGDFYSLYSVKDTDTIEILQNRLQQEHNIDPSWAISFYYIPYASYMNLLPTKTAGYYKISTVPYLFLSNQIAVEENNNPYLTTNTYFIRNSTAQQDINSYLKTYGQDYSPNSYNIEFQQPNGKAVYLFGVRDSDTIAELQNRIQKQYNLSNDWCICVYDQDLPAYFKLNPSKTAADYSLSIFPYVFFSNNYVNNYLASTDNTFYTKVYGTNYIPPLSQSGDTFDIVEESFGSFFNPFSSTPAQYKAHKLQKTTNGFKNKNLSGTDFSNQDLSNYDFTGANLSNANFTAATVTNANFTQANLQGANFEQCNITLAQLLSAQTFVEGWFSGNNQFKGADFSGKLLTKCSFENCDLTGTNFNNTNLTGTDFSNAILTRTSFISAHMDTNTSFESAILDDADLTKSVFMGNLLQQALSYKNINVSFCDFGQQDLTTLDFSNCNLTGTNLNGANCTGVDFSRATITVKQLSSTQTLSQANLSYLVLDGLNYDKKSLANAIIRNSSCKNTSFKDSILDGITLINSDCSNASFDKASINQPIFQNCIFKNAVFTNNTSLTGADFSSCNMEGAIFKWANPNQGSFDDTTLLDTQLQSSFGPTLNYPKDNISFFRSNNTNPYYPKLLSAFQNADVNTLKSLLENTTYNYTDADCMQVISNSAGIWAGDNTILPEALRYNTNIAANDREAVLACLEYLNKFIDNFRNNNKNNLAITLNSSRRNLFIYPFNFSNLDNNLRLSMLPTSSNSSDIYFYTLTYLDPQNNGQATGKPHKVAARIGNNFNPTTISLRTQISQDDSNNNSTSWCQLNFNIQFKQPPILEIVNNQDFSNQNLSFQWFKPTQFQQCNFSHAIVENSYFEGSDLSGSNLSNANFTQANLRNCNLSNTDCTNAIMSAILDKADFTNAILTNTFFAFSTGFTGSQLMQAQPSHAGIILKQLQQFQNCDFSNHDFSQGDISSTNLSSSQFDNANLSSVSAQNSRCQNTSFKNTNLTGANFSQATLTEADLRGANLTKTDFRGADLRQAIFSSKNQLKNAIVDSTTRLDKILKIK